jgi:small subunit ribosomal protein S1
MVNVETKDEQQPQNEEQKQTLTPDDGGKAASKVDSSRGDTQSFQELYQESLRTMEEGQILKGTVIDITPDHVTIDVGYKSEGRYPFVSF